MYKKKKNRDYGIRYIFTLYTNANYEYLCIKLVRIKSKISESLYIISTENVENFITSMKCNRQEVFGANVKRPRLFVH